MLEAYSLNVAVPAGTAIPFNNITLNKCNDVTQNGPASFQLNKCGVYQVSCDCSAAAASTIQLFKDGVAQPQAQSTGSSPCFTTYVQVPQNNNNCCPCSSPVNIQIRNTGTAAATFTDANVTIRKVV